MIRFICTVFFFLSTHAFSASWYIGLAGGPTSSLSDEDNLLFISPAATIPTPKYRSEIMSSFYLGRELKAPLGLEFFYTNLGTLKLGYGETFEYKRDLRALGLALRAHWKWVSIKFGLAQLSSQGNIFDSAGFVSHQLDQGKKNFLATVFSMGLNIPVSDDLFLTIESVAYRWRQDDGTLIYNDGMGSLGSHKLSRNQIIHAFNLGLRFYL